MTTNLRPELLQRRSTQAAGAAIAFLSVAGLHLANDGLWFGDAPIHAASGLFWWDVLAMRPANPLEFTVRYFARYPVIQPATYPPLFYLVEGAAFAAAGPSPHVAKLLVLASGIATGLYTMAWGRRWISPGAGWAGAFLAFVPGMVLWSNAVMLNMPATALGLGGIYHARRWLDSADSRQLLLAAACTSAVLLTYYPGAVAVPVIAALALARWRDITLSRRTIWIAAAALCAAVPLAAAMVFSPVHTARHLPSAAFLAEPSTWLLYWYLVPQVVGWPALVLGASGGAMAGATARYRSEAITLAIMFLALVAALSVLPARDPRYLLLAAPTFVLGAAAGIASVRTRPGVSARWGSVVLAGALGAGFWYAARVDVPRVSGFREIAEYLRQEGPRDAVLYDGPNAARLAFFVRTLDAGFEQRVTEGQRLLYHYGPAESFSNWTQSSDVRSVGDVMTQLRSRCGCRWVLVEDWSERTPIAARRLLRDAIEGPEFQFVRSFPVTGVRSKTVDLYRFSGEIEPVSTLKVSFPSFHNRVFDQVAPITR